MSSSRNCAPFLLAIALPALAAGCTPTIATRGNLLEEERISVVKAGATKNDVIAAWGTPTMVGTFDDTSWYYAGQRTKKNAFFDPKVIERKVVAVRFDTEDKVAAIEQLGEGDGQKVDLIDRETPTAGKDLTITEQLLGNMGRFAGKGGGSKGAFSTPSGQRGRSRGGI